jgi:hypothetical protein
VAATAIGATPDRAHTDPTVDRPPGCGSGSLAGVSRRRAIGLLACLIVVGSSLVGCSRAPSKAGLITKLEQRNGLSTAQARCIANGLYDGMPDEQPAIRRLSPGELRAVAKPDNAGKVPADVVQILRDVTSACVATTPEPAAP